MTMEKATTVNPPLNAVYCAQVFWSLPPLDILSRSREQAHYRLNQAGVTEISDSELVWVEEFFNPETLEEEGVPAREYVGEKIEKFVLRENHDAR